jgi:hypothetical protein
MTAIPENVQKIFQSRMFFQVNAPFKTQMFVPLQTMVTRVETLISSTLRATARFQVQADSSRTTASLQMFAGRQEPQPVNQVVDTRSMR